MNKGDLAKGRLVIRNEFSDGTEEDEKPFAVPLQLFTELDARPGLVFSAQALDDAAMVSFGEFLRESEHIPPELFRALRQTSLFDAPLEKVVKSRSKKDFANVLGVGEISLDRSMVRDSGGSCYFSHNRKRFYSNGGSIGKNMEWHG